MLDKTCLHIMFVSVLFCSVLFCFVLFFFVFVFSPFFLLLCFAFLARWLGNQVCIVLECAALRFEFCALFLQLFTVFQQVLLCSCCP